MKGKKKKKSKTQYSTQVLTERYHGKDGGGGGRLARGENNKSRHRNRKRLYNVRGG